VKSLSLLSKIAVVALMGVVFVGCGSKPVVGVLLPTSGSAASYGNSMKEGIELAIEQGRADGTMPASLVFVWADTGTDPARAVDELGNLSSQGANIVIMGTTSDTARQLLPELDRLNVVALSPSASAPNLTKDSKLFFRVFASDELEGRRAGRFLREEQDATTAMIFAEDSEQARGIEPPFRQVFEQAMEGRVVGRVSLSDPNWVDDANDVLAAHLPDAVYVIGYADPSLEVLRLLRNAQYEGTICLTSAFYSGEIIEKDPALVEGVFFPQPAFDMKDERELVQNFVTSFTAKFGHEPDIYAAHAFDAARVVAQVIAEAPVYDSSNLRKGFMFSVKEFPGVTGIIQFNDYGDVHHNPIMFTIRDGQVLNFERFVKEQKVIIRSRIRNLLQGG